MDKREGRRGIEENGCFKDSRDVVSLTKEDRLFLDALRDEKYGGKIRDLLKGGEKNE